MIFFWHKNLLWLRIKFGTLRFIIFIVKEIIIIYYYSYKSLTSLSTFSTTSYYITCISIIILLFIVFKSGSIGDSSHYVPQYGVSTCDTVWNSFDLYKLKLHPIFISILFFVALNFPLNFPLTFYPFSTPNFILHTIFLSIFFSHNFISFGFNWQHSYPNFNLISLKLILFAFNESQSL
jgi:hypothetical protein